jgi:glycosyltransferase involved in cell wall biosynthesis
MRILTVCSNFRVFGAENITLKLLEGLRANCHELLAVTSVHSDGEFSRRLEAIQVREVQLQFGAVALPKSLRAIHWTAHTVLNLPALWAGWLKVMRGFSPDTVVFTGSRQSLLVYPLLNSKPYFLIEHAAIDRNVYNHALYQILCKKMSRFVAVSDAMRGFYTGMGVPTEMVRVIKNGPFFRREFPNIDSRLSSRCFSKTTRARLGIVGQIAPDKGHDSLLAAAEVLMGRGVQFEVNVFGSGQPTYLEYTRQRVASAGLGPSWKWMGYESDRSKIFNCIDICVMPSLVSESFGMVAAEAAAHGLPVVASRIGGLPEIVEDGVTGWLVEPNSPMQLADRLEHLINNPDRSREMGAAGRAKIFQEFTAEKMVAEFETLFQEFGACPV